METRNSKKLFKLQKHAENIHTHKKKQQYVVSASKVEVAENKNIFSGSSFEKLGEKNLFPLVTFLNYFKAKNPQI